jgi:Tfp pilus assembly protein PilP
MKVTAKPAAKTAATASKATAVAASEAEASKSDKQEDKKYSMTGKRDPFVSPVVNRQGGSGCSTGKKCLDIEQIALHGVVKSDNGMIAVVTNSLNKAYFLRENDPVFNGYVVKITVDSIVFKETFQDRLGKPFTKDVVKRILTPAV